MNESSPNSAGASRVLGPNTNADPALLSAKLLLCNGEDEEELRATLAACGLREPLRAHAFRSYRFWRYRDLTVVLSSMGTGPLEALLFETLSARVVEEIALVGTAGQPARSRAPLGVAHHVSAGRAIATGLDAELGDEWQTPVGDWPPAKEDFAGIAYGGAATIVSTDLYYGLSPKNSERYLPRVKALFDATARGAETYDLVDMETAQFYALCRRVPDSGLKKSISFKGAANTLQHQEEQNEHTFGVLLECVKCALVALRIDVAGRSLATG